VKKDFKSIKRFKAARAAPSFLLVLKRHWRSRPAETPAKDNRWVEAGVLIASCFVLIAIALLVVKVLGHHR
jgi:hypothetical protein